MTTAQVHSQFEVFIGQPSAPGQLATSFGKLKAEIEAYAANGALAPKSIGVEYIEPTHQLVMSLGYTAGQEAGYAVRIMAVELGKFDLSDGKKIAAAMSAAAKTTENVLCHEFFVREDNDFVLVLMSKA